MSDPSSAAASSAASATAGHAAIAASLPGGSSHAAPTPSAPLTAAQENRWFVSTFGLSTSSHSSSIDAVEFYAQAKLQYAAGRFQLAIRCLEIYIARLAAASQAAATAAAALPAKAAASSTRATRYGASLAGGGGLVVGAPPLTVPSASKPLPVAPLHLLAHAHRRVGDWPRARECFLACVRLGFDADWQMIVQGELESLASVRANQSKADAAGAEAVATVAKHMAAHHSRMAEEQRGREAEAAEAAQAAARLEDEQQMREQRQHAGSDDQDSLRSAVSSAAAAREHIRSASVLSAGASLAGADDDRRFDSDSDISSFHDGGGSQSNRSSLVSNVSYLDKNLFAPVRPRPRSPSEPLLADAEPDANAAAATAQAAAEAEVDVSTDAAAGSSLSPRDALASPPRDLTHTDDRESVLSQGSDQTEAE